jgi:hypothetical protein
MNYTLTINVDDFRGARIVSCEDIDGKERAHLLIPFLGNGIEKKKNGKNEMKLMLYSGYRNRSSDTQTHIAIPLITKDMHDELVAQGLLREGSKKWSSVVGVAYPAKFGFGKKDDKE